MVGYRRAPAGSALTSGAGSLPIFSPDLAPSRTHVMLRPSLQQEYQSPSKSNLAKGIGSG